MKYYDGSLYSDLEFASRSKQNKTIPVTTFKSYKLDHHIYGGFLFSGFVLFCLCSFYLSFLVHLHCNTLPSTDFD